MTFIVFYKSFNKIKMNKIKFVLNIYIFIYIQLKAPYTITYMENLFGIKGASDLQIPINFICV